MNNEYSELDWTLDLVLELTEENILKNMDRIAVRWDKILDAVEVLKWNRDIVEEIIGGALEVGILYEPVLGYLRLADPDGDFSDNIDHIGPGTITYKGNRFTIHSHQERTDFYLYLCQCRKIREDEKKDNASLIDLRIVNLPQKIAREILDLLGKYPDAGIIVHPMGGS